MAESAVVVGCPKCASKLKLKGEVAGKKVKCPKCEAVFRIGAAKAASTSSASGSEATAPNSLTNRSPAKKKKSAAANQSAPARKKTASKSDDSRLPVRKKRKKKRRPSAEDDGYEDFSNESYGLDDFGDDSFNDDYDDGYDDFGASTGPPARKTKKKKKSKKGKSKSANSGGTFQDSMHRLGLGGWLLCGGVGAIICIGLTTLTGYTDFGFLTSIMSIVTGTVVGGAVRFAAQPTHGWGPGIVAVLLALLAIVVGKTGSFYIWFNETADPEDEWTLRDEVEYATTDEAMINVTATELQEAWLAEGKITQAQINEHWNSDVEGVGFDEDVEMEPEDSPDDYSGEHLPEVWAEAKAQWNAKSAEEQQVAKDEVIRELQVEWIGDEAADMDLEEADKVAAEQEQQGTLFLAFVFAIGNCFLPFHPIFCFFSGLYGAFKLAAGLGN